MEQALLGSLAAAPAVAATPPAAPRRRRTAGVLVLLGVLAVLAVGALLAFFLKPQERFGVEIADLNRVTEVGHERLRDGDRVRVGDRLFMEFRANREAYVYVLNEDLQGSRYLLFPLPGGSLENPLRPRRVHRLPGKQAGGEGREGEELRWEVSSAGQKEYFYIVASTEPRPELEGAVSRMEKGGEGLALSYPELRKHEVAVLLRGIGGLAKQAQEEVVRRKQPLARFIEDLRRGAGEEEDGESDRGIWIQAFTLENPPVP
jgi:hypothetical protein